MPFLKISRILLAVFLPAIIFPITFLAQLYLGPDASLFPLYMLSIAGLSWELGFRGAIVSVIISTGLWVASHVIINQVYDNPFIIYYNAGARTAAFIMMAYFIFMFRRVVEQHRSRMESMRAMLNVCHGCGSLQGSDGKWIKLTQLDELTVARRFECPDCAQAQLDSSNPKT